MGLLRSRRLAACCRVVKADVWWMMDERVGKMLANITAAYRFP